MTDDDVLSAARRLLDPSCLAGGYDDDLEIVARAALVAGAVRSWAEALEAWATNALGIAMDRRIPSADMVADGEAIVAGLREALAASGTTPRPEHQFLPRSGSQDAQGVYARCGVNGCDLAPEQHTAPSPTCDACGLPITEDYVEAVSEGVEGEYHVVCVPPGLPMRTVLIS